MKKQKKGSGVPVSFADAKRFAEKEKAKAIPIQSVINRTRQQQFRELKRAQVLHFNYTLVFPDGDVWKKTTPFVNDLAWNLQQLINEKTSFKSETNEKSEWRDRALALWNNNECWFKDKMGVEHIIRIEERPISSVELKLYQWGVKKGMGDTVSGVGKDIEDGLTKLEQPN